MTPGQRREAAANAQGDGALTTRQAPRFETILAPAGVEPPTALTAPECFRDLALDQVVADLTAAWKDCDLAPYFQAPLADLETIAYRQEAMRELEDDALRSYVESFAQRMREMRQYLGLAAKLDPKEERERRLLCAVEVYVEAVQQLARDLRERALRSAGMCALRAYLARYAASASFVKLAADAAAVARDLARIRYSVLIHDDTVTVRRGNGEDDYTAEVERTFEKFCRGAVKDWRVKFRDAGSLNHIEAQVLACVARLYPDEFRAQTAFCAAHADFADPTLVRFDREVHFYLAVLNYLEPLRRAGLHFCWPQVSAASKEVGARATFDLALAARLVGAGEPVVCNDFDLHDPERLFVVSGPNQGGKTTFARTFGQLHYLAALGCPVPGEQARLFLFDRIHTHFEREEDVATLRGKLYDDLVRMRAIFDRATPRSIVIINEIFASTTLEDAVCLGRRVLAELSRLDVLGVCVTFLDELASFDDKTVSVVSTVDPDDPAVRTFRLERRPADGLAYAQALARKRGVTRAQLRARWQR